MMMANGCIEKYLNVTQIATYLWYRAGQKNKMFYKSLKWKWTYNIFADVDIVSYVNRANTVLG